jgi:glycosyltransferase involved in cell wall biosynthesis
MRFSVDAHAIGQHLTGNETYIRNLLRCFASIDHNADFITYISRPNAIEHLPGRFRKVLVAENPYRRLGYDLTRRLRIDSPDLLHVQYTAPIACPVPIVVSVHDVSFLDHPEFFTRFRAFQLKCTVRRTVKAASKVLTPSEFSRAAVIRAYRLPEHKVVVMPNAVSSFFRPVPRERARQWIKSKLGYDFPFVLAVGDLQPRKNHIRIIQAFEEILRMHPNLPHHLVLVGKDTWYSGVIRTAVAKSPAASRIHLTGFVEDEVLLRLYGACDVSVYPSLYEGFGIPILEAMACGRAVACSNTTAMPEVADSCALLFDPYSIKEIFRAIRDLMIDPELRTRMERLGTQRANLFSWEHTARKTLDVYYDVAGRGREKAATERDAVSLASS